LTSPPLVPLSDKVGAIRELPLRDTPKPRQRVPFAIPFSIALFGGHSGDTMGLQLRPQDFSIEAFFPDSIDGHDKIDLRSTQESEVKSATTPTVEFVVQIIVEPDEVGFHAYCPALKGVHVDGETEEEALQNARDACIAYLRSLIKHGEPIPIGITPLKARRRGQSSVRAHVEKLHIDNLALTTA